MRRHRALLAAAFALVASVAACAPTTAPTDEDLLGTWTIQPADVPLPGGGGMQQMTVHFGGSGDYTLETATYGGLGSGELVKYEKTVGSVTVEDGGLRFHPTGSVGWDRRRAPYQGFPAFDAQVLQQAPVPYTVSGDNLVLRLTPTGYSDSMVLTRQENE